MKKALIAAVAIGSVVALRPLSKRVGRKMSQHCAQMASKCKEMMSTHEATSKPADTQRRCDQEAPQFLGDREPVETI